MILSQNRLLNVCTNAAVNALIAGSDCRLWTSTFVFKTACLKLITCEASEHIFSTKWRVTEIVDATDVVESSFSQLGAGHVQRLSSRLSTALKRWSWLGALCGIFAGPICQQSVLCRQIKHQNFSNRARSFIAEYFRRKRANRWISTLFEWKVLRHFDQKKFVLVRLSYQFLWWWFDWKKDYRQAFFLSFIVNFLATFLCFILIFKYQRFVFGQWTFCVLDFSFCFLF